MEFFAFKRFFLPFGYTGAGRIFYYNGLVDIDKYMTVREEYTGWGSVAGTAGEIKQPPSAPTPGYAAERQGQERLPERTAKNQA